MMRKLFILWFVSLILTPVHVANAQSSKTLRVSEKTLRKMAIDSITPKYPREAQKRQTQGVAVAQIEVDEKGIVDKDKVVILEAPSPLIKTEVTNAIVKWKFKPNTINKEPVRLSGKLTFYYSIKNGKATVESPFDEN